MKLKIQNILKIKIGIKKNQITILDKIILKNEVQYWKYKKCKHVLSKAGFII